MSEGIEARRDKPRGLPPAAITQASPGAFTGVVVAFVLSALSAWLCRAVAGISLGLFFGTVAFITLIVPPLVTSAASLRTKILMPLAASLGAATACLFAIGSQLTLSQWSSCSLIFLSYAFSVSGLCSLAMRSRVNRFVTSGIIAILALLWLTWPVWLSNVLLHSSGETLVGWLTPAHPLFAINHVLEHFDSWDRYPLAYGQLTVLNQDVFYAMPTTIAWTLLVHGTIAIITFAAAWWLESSRESAPAAASSADHDPASSAR